MSDPLYGNDKIQRQWELAQALIENNKSYQWKHIDEIAEQLTNEETISFLNVVRKLNGKTYSRNRD